jgi:hypothetical protein
MLKYYAWGVLSLHTLLFTPIDLCLRFSMRRGERARHTDEREESLQTTKMVF